MSSARRLSALLPILLLYLPDRRSGAVVCNSQEKLIGVS